VPLQGNDGVPSGIVPNAPFGVWGDSGTGGGGIGGGNGVIGTSSNYSGVAGQTASQSNFAAGVYGGGHIGVAGVTPNATTAPAGSVGVYGTGSNGQNLGGIGVEGVSDSSTGVRGISKTGAGVFGESTDGYNFGVIGLGANAGVAAFNPNNQHAAYLASDCCAAWLTGDVVVTGKFFKGGGGFQIDHPLEPSTKFLAHSFVESNEMKNIYDGIAAIDARGEAVIVLPRWFEALNSDFRYQLTAVGKPSPNLHVAEEVRNNRFKIGGAIAGEKVSWTVTGIRRDAWAQANGLSVEEEKGGLESGKYLHPELHGAGNEQSIGRLRHPHTNAITGRAVGDG